MTNTTQLPKIDTSMRLTRLQAIALLRASLSLDSLSFARQTALSWLAYFPGDLLIIRLYAQALYQSGFSEQALPLLENLCIVDPENIEAQNLLFLTKQAEGIRNTSDSFGCVYVLGNDNDAKNPVPEWARLLRQARNALINKDFNEAEEIIHQVLLNEPLTALAAITHLVISNQRDLPLPSLRDLSAFYHRRWPTCLPCTLLYAESLIDDGEAEKAVALIHQVAVQDVAGEVIERMWGQFHPYRVLWPEHLEAPLDSAIPSEVLSALGWNQLPLGNISPPPQKTHTEDSVPEKPISVHDDKPDVDAETISHPVQSTETDPDKSARRHPVFPSIPESLRSIQSELERVAGRLKQNHLAQADGRFPVYVLFTTRQGLEAQFGVQTVAIDEALVRLSTAIRKRCDWGAQLVYADDPHCMSDYGLQPAKPDDPWDLKLALVDLDAALTKRGEMIGAVLIIGGPEVVPFHHLPNPVDDFDADVPSDNPYATRDENYFVPEWLVGRLPNGAHESAEALINVLDHFTERHTTIVHDQPWYKRWWRRLILKLRVQLRPRPARIRPSWGYTAAIWRRASVSVFRTIGQPHALLVSPPVHADAKLRGDGLLPSARLGYFNLHGLQDASEWYGHRDPAEPSAGPDYPIALRPQDVTNGGRAPQIVFTEACYGSHIIGKNIEEALSLKFLASGSQVVVGSTCTSYGSITTPLIAADLLGIYFWKYLKENLTAGEALRRAKIHLAREMLRRQGYLDGEDQKTLISFVLYGDPLAQLSDFEHQSKSVFRPLKRPAKVKTICDRASGDCKAPQPESPVPVEVLAQVKHVVEKYLPGMEDAQVTFSAESPGCQENCQNCPSAQLNRKSTQNRFSERKVVTLSKQVACSSVQTDNYQPDEAVQIHRHYARLTLDGQGKLIKLSVSR